MRFNLLRLSREVLFGPQFFECGVGYISRHSRHSAQKTSIRAIDPGSMAYRSYAAKPLAVNCQVKAFPGTQVMKVQLLRSQKELSPSHLSETLLPTIPLIFAGAIWVKPAESSHDLAGTAPEDSSKTFKNSRSEGRDSKSVVHPTGDRYGGGSKPFESVEYFVGRHHALERLESIYKDRESSPIVIISAGPGMGKTQLIRKWLSDHLASGDIGEESVLFAHAESPLKTDTYESESSIVVIDDISSETELFDLATRDRFPAGSMVILMTRMPVNAAAYHTVSAVLRLEAFSEGETKELLNYFSERHERNCALHAQKYPQVESRFEVGRGSSRRVRGTIAGDACDTHPFPSQNISVRGLSQMSPAWLVAALKVAFAHESTLKMHSPQPTTISQSYIRRIFEYPIEDYSSLKDQYEEILQEASMRGCLHTITACAQREIEVSSEVASGKGRAAAEDLQKGAVVSLQTKSQIYEVPISHRACLERLLSSSLIIQNPWEKSSGLFRLDRTFTHYLASRASEQTHWTTRLGLVIFGVAFTFMIKDKVEETLTASLDIPIEIKF